MSDYFSRVERQLVVRVSTSRRRRRLAVPRLQPWPGALAAIASCAVVVAVIVALGGLGDGPGRSGPAVSPASGVTLLAITPGGQPATGSQLRAAVATLRRRLRTALPAARLSVSGSDVTVRGTSPAQRPLVLGLSGPGALQLFDWERSVVIGGPASVIADLEHGAGPLAVTISQGRGSAAPGSAAAGAMTIGQAALVGHNAGLLHPLHGAAARDRPASFYLLAPGRDPACAATAASGGFAAAPANGVCLLAGPAPSRAALHALVAPGVSPSAGRVVTVAAGYAIVQAIGPGNGPPIAPGAAGARFFVVGGPVDLTSADLARVHPSTDASGQPDVALGFRGPGASRFQAATARIAHRGQLVSRLHQSLSQHFAVAIDGRLITVPQIDFRTYPDGVTGASGADITGGFTRASARALAAVLTGRPLGVSFVAR